MSKENLDQFIQKVTNSEELQTRIGDEIDTDAFIALGTEHDCEFSAEDLTESAALSDEELDGVAGGMLSVNTNVSSFNGGAGDDDLNAQGRFRIVRKKTPNHMNTNDNGNLGG